MSPISLSFHQNRLALLGYISDMRSNILRTSFVFSLLVYGLVFLASSNPVQAAAPPSGAAFATGYVDLSVGYRGACGVKSNGTVRCWGYNQVGELGSTSANYTRGTVPIAGITNATSVSFGFFHVCARLSTGQVKCWGSNGSGQLGNKTYVNSPTPVTVLLQNGTPLTSVLKVSAAKEGTCALLENETVTCWGNGADGLLGDGTSDDRYYAGPTVGLAGVTSLSTPHEDNKACAVTRQGGVFCWGHEWSPSATNLAPVQKAGITGASLVSTGSSHSCVTTTGSTFNCWGDGTWQKQTGTTQVSGDIYTTPGLVISSIDAKNARTCVVLVDTTAKCWGSGGMGVLGTGSESDRSTAASVKVSGSEVLTGIDRIELGESLACALLINTSIYCWGFMGYTARPWASWGTAETSYAGPISDSSAPVLDSISFEKNLPGSGKPGLQMTLSGIQYCTSGFEGVPIIQVEVSKKPDLSENLGASNGGFESCENLGPLSTSFILDQVSSQHLTSQLEPATKYYYRVTILSAYGNLVDEIRSFVTAGKKAVFGPTRTITATQSSVKILLNYDSEGLTSISDKCTFAYDSAMEKKVLTMEMINVMNGALTCEGRLLEEGTTYYFQAETTNAVGTTKSDIIMVSTTKTPGITVNNGELYTNSPKVKISLTFPEGSGSFTLSNDGGFAAGTNLMNTTEKYLTVDWTLATSGQERLPKTVYVRFNKSTGDAVTLTDDIILDTTPPSLTNASATTSSARQGAVSVASVRAKSKGGVKMLVKASDANSGIGSIEVRTSSRGRATKIQYSNPTAKSQTVNLKTTSKLLQVRVIDRAGNSSKWKDVKVR
jgi:hypothetical protein